MSTVLDRRIAGWFAARRWRVRAELNGTMTDRGVKITYTGGAFEVDRPGAFATPLGHRGRHGYAIIEVDADGKDIPGTSAAFGEALLRRASRAYGTISGLPGEEG